VQAVIEAEVPWIERPDWAGAPELVGASDVHRQAAARFNAEGVVHLPGAVDPALCAASIERLRPHAARSSGERLTNAWWALETVRSVARAPGVLDVLRFLYGRRPIPFQTLDFCRGTEQEAHRDSLHFDSLPHGFMCGVWVALEDVGAGQGPVRYRPGSHRAGAGDTLPEVDFVASAGDAFVWAADLLHGGAPVLEPEATRWSQVTHYFFEGCVYITPMRSDPAARSYEVRRPLVEVGGWRPVEHRLDGAPVRFVHHAGRRSTILGAGERRRTGGEVAMTMLRDVPRYAAGLGRPLLGRVTRRPPVR
jgi:hypothetical protein